MAIVPTKRHLALAIGFGVAIAGGVYGATAPAPTSGRLPGLTDVLATGADPTGKQDSTPAFRAALEAKDVWKVVIPCGVYRLAGTITVPYAKTLEGFGACSELRPDAGLTAIRVTGGSGGAAITVLRDFRVMQYTQHKDNIGILLEFGEAPFEDWVLERLSLLGSALNGANLQSGIGVSARFALKGVIRDCVIQWWDTGVAFGKTMGGSNSFANANLITGSKIRANRVGVDLFVDTAYLVGNTIEANQVGVRANTQSALVAAVIGNHFENTAQSGTDLELLGGRVTSVGNTYAGQFAGKTPTFIVRDGRAVSVGDVLAFGSSAQSSFSLKPFNN